MLSTNCYPETTSTRRVGEAQKVFEEHGGFIKKTIRFHLGNGPEAEDLFQDMFLFLVSKPLPEGVRNVPSFLYRMITARIIDKFRRETWMKAHISKYVQDKEWKAGKTAKPSLTEIAIEEKSEKLFELVQEKLTKSQALAITLRYKYNLDTNQAADEMGIEPRSVSHCLAAGIRRLRRITKSKL